MKIIHNIETNGLRQQCSTRNLNEKSLHTVFEEMIINFIAQVICVQPSALA